MDNLLFEKAYTHMIDILKRFPSILRDRASASTEEISEETVNPKELFCTKKSYLMAMIAFLNGCYEAVASEKKAKDNVSAIDLSQVIYQWDLTPPDATISLQPLTSTSAENKKEKIEATEMTFDAQVKPETSIPVFNKPTATSTTSKKSIQELLQLIGVTDEPALLALPEEIFDEKVKGLPLKNIIRLENIRANHQCATKEQQELEEDIRKASEQEAVYQRFLKRKIVGKYTNEYGETLYHVIFDDSSSEK